MSEAAPDLDIDGGMETSDGPPPFDPVAVGRVVRRVEIDNVELIGCFFDRADSEPIPTKAPSTAEFAQGIDVEWKSSSDQAVLGCLLTFGTVFDEENGPYKIVGRFRLTYNIQPGDLLEKGDFEQFAHWNATFNAWPYWRELVGNFLSRSDLPRVTVPVMRVPSPG